MYFTKRKDRIKNAFIKTPASCNKAKKKKIIKKVQASDKRKVIVSLTELGYDIYNRKLLFFKEYIERILTTIGNDELDRFFDTLKKITQIGEEIND